VPGFGFAVAAAHKEQRIAVDERLERYLEFAIGYRVHAVMDERAPDEVSYDHPAVRQEAQALYIYIIVSRDVPPRAALTALARAPAATQSPPSRSVPRGSRPRRLSACGPC